MVQKNFKHFFLKEIAQSFIQPRKKRKEDKERERGCNETSIVDIDVAYQ